MTTPRRLLSSLQNAIDTKARCFVGEVQYKRQSALQAYFYEINLLDASGCGIAKSLLYKRVQFRHEAEVRLIYCAEEKTCFSDVFSYNISPDNLFNEVLFDPRMNLEQQKLCTEAISCLGYNFSTRRSMMYDAPSSLRLKLPSQTVPPQPHLLVRPRAS